MFIVTYELAGITFRLESDVLISQIREHPFKRFEIPDMSPDVLHRFQQLDLDSTFLPPLDAREREALIRSVHFPERWLDHHVFRFPEVRAVLQRCLDQPELVQIALAWDMAVFRNFAHNEYVVFYPPKSQNMLKNQAVMGAYRTWMAPSLVGYSAVMIHGASTIRCNEMAAVFLAADGGGKTSLIRQSVGVPVLSDDHIVLRREVNDTIVHSTPFGRITIGPHQARLGAFFLLEKASHFELIPAKPRDVLEFIWNEHKLTWYALPQNLRLKAFDVLHEACCQAAAYRLRLPRDYVEWEAIDAVMMR